MNDRIAFQTRLVVGLVALLVAGCFPSVKTWAQSETRESKTSSQEKLVWEMAQANTKASLRGLHVFDAKHIFASGSGGTVVQSRDGGKTWAVQTVPGAESLDFRDIHAIDSQNLVIMSSGSPARIYRSYDGGKSWKITFEQTDEKFFLDAIGFLDGTNGFVMGDPIDGRVLLLRTTDAGNSWQRIENSPKLLPGEAGFAASGTNMVAVGPSKVAIALGGALEGEVIKQSRVLMSNDLGQSWQVCKVPIPRGPSAGIFSLHFIDDQNAVAVGGDYKKETATTGTIAITKDGGKTWSVPTGQGVTGFRSCTASISRALPTVSGEGESVSRLCVSVGPSGTDASIDVGNVWFKVSDTGFHAIDAAPNSTAVWACGSNGRIGKLKIEN